MAIEIFFNDTGTALSSTIDNSTTSITVNSVAAYPTSFSGLQFRIRIDDEIMIVTAISSSSRVLTVTRGVESTVASTHQAGAQVTHILTAGGVTNLVTQVRVGHGALSALPSAGNSGFIYFPTNAPYLLVDNGSSWDYYAISKMAAIAPSAASFSGLNASTSAVSVINGNTLQFAMVAGSDQFRGFQLAIPQGGSTFTVSSRIYPGNYSASGRDSLYVYNSGNGRIMSWGWRNDGTYGASAERWSSTTSYNVEVNNYFSGRRASPNGTWFRWKGDGTNLYCGISWDGTNFVDWWSETLATWIGAVTHVGVGGWCSATGSQNWNTLAVDWNLV